MTQEAAAALQVQLGMLRLMDVVDDMPLTVWSYISWGDAHPGPGFVGWCRATIRKTRKVEPPFLCGPPPTAWSARLDVLERR